MNVLEMIIVALLATFFLGSCARVITMLNQKKIGHPMMRFRMLFFFTTCLMLICLIPLGIFHMLSVPIVISDLSVVMANLVGLAMTFQLREKNGVEASNNEGHPTVRAYQVYFQGSRYGLVTKEGFDKLLSYGLLKRQRTVELDEDFQRKARQQGLSIDLVQNRDGSQTLIRVEVSDRS